MTWKIRQKYRSLLAGELNLIDPPRGGGLSVCLVYPNHYRVGMGSLGFQTVYRILNQWPGVCCERAFLPEGEELEEYRQSGTPLLSLESQRPLSDFDLIAFSVSFEPDYSALPQLLSLARIPCRSRERSGSDPLVMAGGAALTINPEPVADFLDLIGIGEGEALLPPLLELLTAPGTAGRDDLLRRLACIPGIYVPSLYEPLYSADRLTGFRHDPELPFPVERAATGADTPRPPASSCILSSGAEFGDMFLMEVSRGCGRGCRFCSSGFTFGSFRQLPYETLTAEAERGLQHRGKIGLVGAAVSDHRHIGRLCGHVVGLGGTVSVSSLRIDRIDDAMLDALVASGHRTVSLAPEGGSQRMRDLVRKNLTREQILAACDLLIARDILNLRLYFIIGLPGETEDDLREMLELVTDIREKVLERARANRRLGEIVLSVNPFIPKPFTPLQWAAMQPLPSLERTVKFLEREVRRLPNVRLKLESLREAQLQALLSRGDRRLSGLLELLAGGMPFKKALRTAGIDVDHYAHRTIPPDELLPWSVISSADGGLLAREYQAAVKLSR